MSEIATVPLAGYREYPVEEMRRRLKDFYDEVSRRRTVREFSDRPVPRDIIETAPQLPYVYGCEESVHASQVDYVIEGIDQPMPELPNPEPS